MSVNNLLHDDQAIPLDLNWRHQLFWCIHPIHRWWNPFAFRLQFLGLLSHLPPGKSREVGNGCQGSA
eukprot:8928316-Karenia_brevis.AAC.1